MVEKQENNWEQSSPALVPENINPENSGDIAEVAEKDPRFKEEVDGMVAESRKKNETIITNRDTLHAETVKKLERRILAERNALEGTQINIEERENSKIWWDMGTDHNESLDAAIEAENLDREEIQKRLDEYQALLAQAQESYKKTQDDQRLGDEAVKAGDYQKAQELYNRAALWISHQNQEIHEKIGESTQLAEDTVAQAELGKEVAGGIRTTAIVVGATLAVPLSGWASLAALWNAVAIGTTAWALGQITEQSWEVIFNDKDWSEAFIDGSKGTWQAALDSALAGTGMMSGLKVAGIAGKAWYGALSTGMIAGWVNTATQSATRTGLDVSQKTATFFVENWDKIKDLSASEVANVYAEHMAAQWLTPDQIAKNFAFDVATWALGWGVWAKFGPLQEATKWVIKQLGLQASEVWSDAALAVVSAHARNYMNNGTWDASPEEIQKELVNALTGSMTGKYGEARRKMSQSRGGNTEEPSLAEEITPDNSGSAALDKIFDTGKPEELTTGDLRPKIQEIIRNAGDEWAQDTKRVEIAEEMIQQLRWRGEQLTPTEQKAILDAHDIKPTGADGKYTAADIAKKTRMLAEAFPWSENKSIREALIRNGVCGEVPKNKTIQVDGKSHLDMNLFFAEYPGGNVTLKMKWKKWEEFTYHITKTPDGDYTLQKNDETPTTVSLDLTLYRWKILDPDLYGDSVEWITATMWDEAETPFRTNKHSTLGLLGWKELGWNETEIPPINSSDAPLEIEFEINSNTEGHTGRIQAQWSISPVTHFKGAGPDSWLEREVSLTCKPFIREHVNLYCLTEDGRIIPMEFSPTTGLFHAKEWVSEFWKPNKYTFFYEEPGKLDIDSPLDRRIERNRQENERRNADKYKEEEKIREEWRAKGQLYAEKIRKAEWIIASMPENLAAIPKDKKGNIEPKEIQRARVLFDEAIDFVKNNDFDKSDWMYPVKILGRLKTLLPVLAQDWYTDPETFKNDINRLCSGVWKWEDFHVHALPRKGESVLSYFGLRERPIVGLQVSSW